MRARYRSTSNATMHQDATAPAPCPKPPEDTGHWRPGRGAADPHATRRSEEGRARAPFGTPSVVGGILRGARTIAFVIVIGCSGGGDTSSPDATTVRSSTATKETKADSTSPSTTVAQEVEELGSTLERVDRGADGLLPTGGFVRGGGLRRAPAAGPSFPRCPPGRADLGPELRSPGGRASPLRLLRLHGPPAPCASRSCCRPCG